MDARHKKILAAEAKLMQKQQNEMNALRKKLQGKMNERLKLREVEHNEILQRYENAKKLLENQQTVERNRLEKHYQTRPIQGHNKTAAMKSTSMMNASKIQNSIMKRK